MHDSGAFYGPNSPSNISRPLPGPRQTNQRAELWAVVLLLENDPRWLDVRTDSSYVHEGFRRWPLWRHIGWPGCNRDLWDRVGAALETTPGRVLTCKVKGHAKWVDVERRRCSLADKVGNDQADKLAGQGADLHQAMIGMEAAAQERLELAKQVHKRMVDILMDRESGLSELPSHVVDPPAGRFARRVARRFDPPDPCRPAPPTRPVLFAVVP